MNILGNIPTSWLYITSDIWENFIIQVAVLMRSTWSRAPESMRRRHFLEAMTPWRRGRSLARCDFVQPVLTVAMMLKTNVVVPKQGARGTEANVILSKPLTSNSHYCQSLLDAIERSPTTFLRPWAYDTMEEMPFTDQGRSPSTAFYLLAHRICLRFFFFTFVFLTG